MKWNERTEPIEAIRAILDEYGVKLKVPKNRGRAVRKWAKTLLRRVDGILDQSSLLVHGELVVEPNMELLHAEMEAIGSSLGDKMVEYAVDNDKVLIKLRPEAWHSLLSGSIDSLFKGDVAALLITTAIEGKWNWHILEKEPALILVNRVELGRLIGIIRTMLIGLSSKKRLSEEGWVLYATMVLRGCALSIGEVGPLEADRIVFK